MTHLAADIRMDALSIMEWLLEVAGEDIVACPGGWVKTLKSFMSMMGWASSSSATKWTSASKASFGNTVFGKSKEKGWSRQLLVMSQFLKAGLVAEEVLPLEGAPQTPQFDVSRQMIPARSNAFAHLNLFGSSRDEEGEMYIDREDRQRVFHKRFRLAVTEGLENSKKEAGETGRAAAVMAKVLRNGMDDYSGVDDTQ